MSTRPLNRRKFSQALLATLGGAVFLPLLPRSLDLPDPAQVPMHELATRAGMPAVGALLGEFDRGRCDQVFTTHFNAGTTAIAWRDHVLDYGTTGTDPNWTRIGPSGLPISDGKPGWTWRSTTSSFQAPSAIGSTARPTNTSLPPSSARSSSRRSSA